jgi:condensation domain-containing protein
MTVVAPPASSLLPAQEAHWELMCALSPDDPGRSREIVFDYRQLDGQLDEPAFMRAFAVVSRRHEALRLVFSAVGPEPVVRIQEDPEPPAEFVDLSRIDRSSRDDRIQDLVLTESRRRFNLTNGPLWHAWVLRMGPARHWLILCLSHIIADGWSAKVLLDDLLAAYEAEIGAGAGPAGQVPSLAEVWQLQADWLRPQPERLRYWRERLVTLPGPSLFPVTAPPDADLLARRSVEFSLSPATAADVRRLAWLARTTPFMVLMAAHHLQLAVALDKSRTVISTAAMTGVSPRERRAICQHSADPYVAVLLPEECRLLDVVRQTHESMTAALLNMAPYTSIARTVNPSFDDHRPWPDTFLFDGNFIDSAFVLSQLGLAGLRIVRPPLRLPAAPTAYSPDLVWSTVPASSRPVWATLSGPGFEINSARDGGVVHYNVQIVPTGLMREFVLRYVWIAGLLAAEPQLTMAAFRERYGRRFPG